MTWGAIDYGDVPAGLLTYELERVRMMLDERSDEAFDRKLRTGEEVDLRERYRRQIGALAGDMLLTGNAFIDARTGERIAPSL